MTTTQAQQLDRCARALRTAECSLPAGNPRRIADLMAARDEIDATLRVLRWRPRPRVSPAVMAVLVVCSLVGAAVMDRDQRLQLREVIHG